MKQQFQYMENPYRPVVKRKCISLTNYNSLTLIVIESAREVWQGCSLGLRCYIASSLRILKEYRANPPVPEARAVSFSQSLYHRSSPSIWQIQRKPPNRRRNA